MKVLLTTTSFQDNPGAHQELYEQQGFDTDYMRGPLTEDELLPIIGNYDALLCGDDELTRNVLKKGKEGKLKYVSKYGVGLDKIDLGAAKELNIPVTNCPGVNQISVAEHVFALLLTFLRKTHLEYNHTRNGKWVRLTGNELYGKTLGLIGLGAIGKEVAIRAKCFGLKVLVYDNSLDSDFLQKHRLHKAESLRHLFIHSDFISLHIPLTSETTDIINQEVVKHQLKNGVIIINTARGRLVNLEALMNGLRKGQIKGYLADVLNVEPMPEEYPLKDFDNVIITPHIGSRTQESVERQGVMAVKNLIAQINS